jgi:hypothetical protein
VEKGLTGGGGTEHRSRSSEMGMEKKEKDMREKLNQFIERAENLRDSSVDSPEFMAWQTDVLCFLKRQYGEGSPEVTSFDRLPFQSLNSAVFGYKGSTDDIEEFQKSLKTAVLYLKNYLSDSDTQIEQTQKQIPGNNENVFIVHGSELDRQVDALTRTMPSFAHITEPLPAANELARQFDALKGVTSSFAHITEPLPAANELTRQFDALKGVTSSFAHITEAFPAANELTRQFDALKDVTSSFAHITEVFPAANELTRQFDALGRVHTT